MAEVIVFPRPPKAPFPHNVSPLGWRATVPPQATALGAAIHHLTKANLEASHAVRMMTAGLHGQADRAVTGLTCRCPLPNNQQMTWTIRWDYDPNKGTHVNAEFDKPTGREVLAYLDLDQDSVPPPIGRATAAQGKKNVETSQNGAYFPTIDRLTKDCGWDKSHYDALPANQKDTYKFECAQNGLRMWQARLT